MKERRLYKRHIVILPTKLDTILTSGEKKILMLKPEIYLSAVHSFILRIAPFFRKEDG